MEREFIESVILWFSNRLGMSSDDQAYFKGVTLVARHQCFLLLFSLYFSTNKFTLVYFFFYTLTSSEVQNGGTLIQIVSDPLFFLFLLVILNYYIEHKSRILKSLQSSELTSFGNVRPVSDLDASSCFVVNFPVTVSIVFHCVPSSMEIQNTLYLRKNAHHGI